MCLCCVLVVPSSSGLSTPVHLPSITGTAPVCCLCRRKVPRLKNNYSTLPSLLPRWDWTHEKVNINAETDCKMEMRALIISDCVCVRIYAAFVSIIKSVTWLKQKLSTEGEPRAEIQNKSPLFALHDSWTRVSRL